jgi:hypothetical protein
MRAPTAGRAAPPPEPVTIDPSAPTPAPVTAAEPPETQPAPAWFLTADDFPRQKIVLATHDPVADPVGVPARWYERRAFVKARWQKISTWVDPLTLATLDPQPSHWRPDPARASLEVPVA